jgi:hypothetical protein
MSDSAKRRLQAIGSQLSQPADSKAGSDSFEGIPLIKKLAPDSNGPRARGKVVIITGIAFFAPTHIYIQDKDPKCRQLLG